jgi:hypothetical protein
MRHGVTGTLGVFAALGLVAAVTAPGYAAAPDYTFTKVADSIEDGFSPFSFDCSSINNRGDIAIKTARVVPRSSQLVQGIYRANVGKTALTTIAEVDDGFDFLGTSPSINDLGQVAFAVRDFTQRGSQFVETQSIRRGSGGKATTIATSADRFSQFGFEPTVNNSGTVAFKAQLNTFDEFNNDQGLFSGNGAKGSALTTHYLSSTSKVSEFSSLSRPSINNLGDVAFEASLDGVGPGIFVTDDASADDRRARFQHQRGLADVQRHRDRGLPEALQRLSCARAGHRQRRPAHRGRRRGRSVRVLRPDLRHHATGAELPRRCGLLRQPRCGRQRDLRR